MSPVSTNSSAPNSDMAIHDRPTIRKPSRAVMPPDFARTRHMTSPMPPVTAIVIRNGAGDSPYARAATIGRSISAASMHSTRPMTCPIIRKFMVLSSLYHDELLRNKILYAVSPDL